MIRFAYPVFASLPCSSEIAQIEEFFANLVKFYHDPVQLNASLDAFMLVLGVLLGIGASAITFRIPFKELIWATAAGFLGWETMYCLSQYEVATLPATTLGAFMVSVTAEILARDRRAPATIYVVPGILPLVPGRAIYNTMLNSLNGEHALASDTGIQALFGAGGIAIGMLLGTAIARGLMHAHLRERALEHELQRQMHTMNHVTIPEHLNKMKKRRQEAKRNIRDISQHVEERFSRFIDNIESTHPGSTPLKNAKELLGTIKARRKKMGGASNGAEKRLDSSDRSSLKTVDQHSEQPPSAPKQRKKK